MNDDRTRPPTAAEARAEVEARREATKVARAAELDERFGDTLPGKGIIGTSWFVTAAFVVVTVPAVIDPDRFIGAFFVVSLVIFFLACALFAIDIVLAAARSRDDAMGIGGLFFLAGCAPRRAQVHLMAALAVQVVVALVAAAVHPFTPLAFGTLVPMVGLSFSGLWAVRHGLFPPRVGVRKS
jgi:hypothetical protein